MRNLAGRATRTATAVLLAGVSVFMAAGSTYRYDTSGGRKNAGMDDLCASFVRWQEVMRERGRPEGDYAKTGMEKFCPGMV